MSSIAKPVSVKLDGEIRSRIDNLAQSRRRSSHWIMREAIKEYVAREEKRDQLYKDLISIWENYQESGHHLTWNEADSWLSQLESGDDAEIPLCHR